LIHTGYKTKLLASLQNFLHPKAPTFIFHDLKFNSPMLIEMLSPNIDYFKSKPAELPKITILLDNGYHPEKLTQALEQIYPQIMTKIQFELSAKPSKADKKAKGQSGFVPVAARWVIERSNAWVERCKSLVKNFDRTLERSNAKLKLCFIRLMLKRLSAV
jgi:Transposase DDE domain